MTYVGAVPTTGDFKLLDSITTSSATTFNLRQGGVAVYPQSANHCIVQLNGINQVPGSSFNIVNDTIVFAEALTSSDVINQILVLGNVNDIGVPSDDTVSTAKIQADAINSSLIADDSISDEHLDNTAITGQTAITSLADTDKFLVSDASDSGNLKYVEKQYLPSGALSLTSATTVGSATSVTINNCFNSSFQTYMIVVQNLRSNSDCNIRLRFSASGTGNSSTGYRYAGVGRDRAGNSKTYEGHDDTSIIIGKSLDGNDGASDLFGVYYVTVPNLSSVNRKRLTGHCTLADSGGNSTTVTYNIGAELEVASTSFDGIIIFTDSGSLRAGSSSDGHGLIKVYGIADS